MPGDLTEAATAGDLVGMAERMGRLDALFLNYGGPPVKPVLEVMEKGWRRCFELIKGPLRLSVPLFRRLGGGRMAAG
jgi:3-oxoacyl-[acyl-carrier protein] reductase